MTPPHRPLISLLQMRQFCQEAVDFAAGKTKDDLRRDRLLLLGLLHLLSMLGEAANRVPRQIRAATPQLPWRAMVGMRNRLIHAYDVVDLAVVWLVLNNDLPELIKQLDEVIESLNDQDSS